METLEFSTGHLKHMLSATRFNVITGLVAAGMFIREM